MTGTLFHRQTGARDTQLDLTSNDYSTIRQLIKHRDEALQKITRLLYVYIYIFTMVDMLVNSLEYTSMGSYSLAKTASYVTSRRSCTFQPQGRNI